MATDDVQRLVTGVAATPATFTVPGNGQMRPKSIFAHFDGTSAGGSFTPALKVTSDGGKLIGIYPIQSAVAAGGSADVTWFRDVGGGGSSVVGALVGARVYSIAVQSFANQTAGSFTFDTVDFDSSGMANLGTDNRVLTAQIPGYYLAIASVTWQPSVTGRRQTLIYKNGFFPVPSGTLVAPSSWNASVDVGTNTGAFIVSLVSLLAGDFLSVGVFQSSGGNLSSSAGNTNQPYQNYLSATLVGFAPA